MDRLQSNSKFSKKSQEQQNVRPVTNSRGLPKGRYQKQYLNGSNELEDSYLTDEIESLAITCSSKLVDRNRDIKASAQVPARESRKQTVENVSIKSRNGNFNKDFILHDDNRRNEHFETRSSRNSNFNKDFTLHNDNGRNESFETRSSRNQKSNLCPKNDKSNNLSENMNRQNVNHEEFKHKNVQNLDNSHAHAVQNYSTKVESSCMPNGSSFNYLEFIDLLHYNIDLMQHKQLLNYALMLRSRILNNILEFKDRQKKGELDFLCALTDGSQTDKNQKLIIRRMHSIISNIVEEAYQNSNISNSNSKFHEPQFSVYPQNSDLISRIDGPNILSKYDDDDENVKLNKNLDDIIYDDDKETTKDKTFHTNDDNDKISSVKTITNNTRKTAYAVDEFLETNNTPHVNTTDFISHKEVTDKESTYGIFRLDNLLNYDIEAMHGDSLMDYAFSLKKRVLENIFYFKNLEREKLEFLCELTDGTQLEVNQKLITTRMYNLIAFSRKTNNDVCIRHPKHAWKPDFSH